MFHLSPTIVEEVLAVGKRLAREAIAHAAGIPGNASQKVREDEATEFLAERAADQIEERDQFLPIIGKYMDLPLVDFAQRRAEKLILRAFIRKVYADIELEKLPLKGLNVEAPQAL